MKLYLDNTVSWLWPEVHGAAIQSWTGTDLRLGDTTIFSHNWIEYFAYEKAEKTVFYLEPFSFLSALQ